MCIICQEWEKQRMTSKEAFRAIGEVLYGEKDPKKVEHLTDLSNRILEKEVPTSESNLDIDQDWWDHTHSDE